MNLSETSPLPALNINELNFDTCGRLRHLDELLTNLGFDDDATILDAGGYPCYMARAFSRRKIITADIYANGHPPYVKASGAALPFPDAVFDVTIACDVLEHVPAQYREGFLSEVSRVSSGAVIIAGPYDTPGTTEAEVLVRRLLPESSPAQRWLEEHVECGLPSLDRTLDSLRDGAIDVRPLPAGGLTEWILFFAGQAVGERDHSVARAMETFIRGFNELHGNDSVMESSTGPMYRHAVVAARSQSVHEQLKKMLSASTITADPKQSRKYVNSLGELLRTVSEAESGRQTNTMSSAETDNVTLEYIERLETMLSHRGMEPPDRRGGEAKSLSRKLRDAFMVLFG